MKILEELCSDSDCRVSGTHWHRFYIDSMLKESVGEYTVVLRVRETGRTRKRRTGAGDEQAP